MEVEVTVKVPQLIYDIYADAAKMLGNYTTEQMMSGALGAYAQYLFEDVRSNGELPNCDSDGKN